MRSYSIRRLLFRLLFYPLFFKSFFLALTDFSRTLLIGVLVYCIVENEAHLHIFSIICPEEGSRLVPRANGGSPLELICSWRLWCAPKHFMDGEHVFMGLGFLFFLSLASQCEAPAVVWSPVFCHYFSLNLYIR